MLNDVVLSAASQVKQEGAFLLLLFFPPPETQIRSQDASFIKRLKSANVPASVD